MAELLDLILDPGHGGKDPGAVSKWGIEEDWTLKISLYQFNRFKELGVKVGITRTSDTTLEENARVAAVKNSGAKYCISNHLNAGGGDRAEVIHSIYDDGKLANEIKTQLLAAGQQTVKVYYRVSANGGDYYYMHRRTGPVKTNIVEYAFIDNEADYKHFAANWEAYAEAVIKAFCGHMGKPYKPKAEAAPITTAPGEIRYIMTGGHAGPHLTHIHDYLTRTGHGFDVKRNQDASLSFLIGPFDMSKPNWKECFETVKKWNPNMQVLTRDQANKWRG